MWKGANSGLECSGIVTAVGARVHDFCIGDEVFAAGLGSWRTYFNTPASLVAHKTPQLSHEQAAALPIAYLTAYYALRHIANLQPGQRVLIHSAAGGVGVAAVQLALAAGAKVVGTAGSETKRAFVRQLGVQHVYDSRSLDFAQQITETLGRKIDVVLNCFTGDFIPKTLDCWPTAGTSSKLANAASGRPNRCPPRGPMCATGIRLGRHDA